MLFSNPTSSSLIAQLKEEHREVKALLEDAVDSEPDERLQLLEEIEEQLIPHARGEEKTVYAAILDLASEDEPSHGLAQEAYEEHKAVDMLLKELKKIDVEDERWIAKMKVIKENIEHHVKEEEEEFLPKISQHLSEEQQRQLLEAYIECREMYKESLPSQDQISARALSRAAEEVVHP